MMGNKTSPFEFILLGLSDLTFSQIPIFLLILLVYVVTLVGNLLIISLVVSHSHLQTPMYFSLANLSLLDIFNSTISTTHLSFNVYTGNRLISYSTCISQVFFFTWFGSTEFLILDMMSYDRYVAICHPLHYRTMISIPLYVGVALSSWTFRLLSSLLHTLYSLRLSFTDPTIIPGLFCELFQLIQLSSSDTTLNFLLLLFEDIFFAIPGFLLTFLSYVFILKTVLNIKLKDGRQKAYSTCSSHLTVVCIFYGTALFNYFNPTNKDFLAGRLMSVFYTIFTPLLNPIIYSLRNNELKVALHRTLSRMRFGS